MLIMVLHKKIWGKELFYPISEDARFLTTLIEHPTLLRRHLKLCVQKGWEVIIHQETVVLDADETKNIDVPDVH